jgi:hypothetical protein
MTVSGWGRNAVKRKKPCRSCETANPLDFQRPTPHGGLCDDCSKERQREYDRQRKAHDRNLAVRRGRDPYAPTHGEKATYQIVQDPTETWPLRSTMTYTAFHQSLKTAVLPPGSVWLVRNTDGTKQRVRITGENAPLGVADPRAVTPQAMVAEEIAT